MIAGRQHSYKYIFDFSSSFSFLSSSSSFVYVLASRPNGDRSIIGIIAVSVAVNRQRADERRTTRRLRVIASHRLPYTTA